MRLATLIPAVAMLVAVQAALAQPVRPLPYWASIAAKEALMRRGPGKDYPGVWLYRRPGLPVRVIGRHLGWRKVQEVDGTTGWMSAPLLDDQRTGLVRRDGAEMRAAPNAGARLRWRAAAGVVGTLTQCSAGWCAFEVGGRKGFVEAGRLWGVAPDEAFD